jgi:hypothetical protein
MIKNEVDEFRNNFFQKLIKEEQEKERAIALAQKNCFHNYDTINHTNHNGYQERTCSKCGHSAIKSLRVWAASKNGNCVIA